MPQRRARVSWRRFVLSCIGAIEQYCLDRHWKTAWKLMDLDHPPFESWERMNADCIRSENANTRLASRRWIAALICEMKDDDFLHKQRGQGGQKGSADA